MKPYLLALCCLATFSNYFAQPFAVGHRTLSLFDANRNRTVTAEVYYPALSTGDNVAFATGSFPVFTLAHGFVIPGDTYQNFANELVPDGYVVVLPTTEGGILPNHDAFGKDIAFLNNAFRSNGVDFFTQWNGRSAIGGHSMGGGASALAATQTEADAYVGLAPAITNPSPVPLGAQIELPALIFSGSGDAVTPPETNHQPIYDAFASSCKTFVSISSGKHCLFIPASLCDLGESGVPGGMTRELQQAITFDFLRPFLQTFLLDDTAAWQNFQQTLPTDNRITYQQTCSIDFTGLNSISDNDISLYPQPCIDVLNFKFNSAVKCNALAVYTIQGKHIEVLPEWVQNGDKVSISIPPNMLAGIYIFEIQTNQGVFRKRVQRAQP